MKLLEERNNYYEIKVEGIRELDQKDKETGKKVYQVIYKELTLQRQFDIEMEEVKKTKTLVELKVGKKYKVEARARHIPQAYLMNGQARATDQIYYTITKVLEEMK